MMKEQKKKNRSLYAKTPIQYPEPFFFRTNFCMTLTFSGNSVSGFQTPQNSRIVYANLV